MSIHVPHPPFFGVIYLFIYLAVLELTILFRYCNDKTGIFCII